MQRIIRSFFLSIFVLMCCNFPALSKDGVDSKSNKKIAKEQIVDNKESASKASNVDEDAKNDPINKPKKFIREILKLDEILVKDELEKERRESKYQAGKTNIGRMPQATKDIPQGLTTITRQLMIDRNADTLKEVLSNASGISYSSLEAGNGKAGDNFSIRGLSAASDLYIDGMRDNVQYSRDTFNMERVEVLRGSSAMLFGRGSVGGLVNQVSKEPTLDSKTNVNFIAGSNSYLRETVDYNRKINGTSAIRINLMKTDANHSRDVVSTDRLGLAPTIKFGIGTDNEYTLSAYHLQYKNVPDFGVPIPSANHAKPISVSNDLFYGTNSDRQRDTINSYQGSWLHKFSKDERINTIVRQSNLDRDLKGIRPFLNTNQTTISPDFIGRGGHERNFVVQSNYNSKISIAKTKHELLVGSEYFRTSSNFWNYTLISNLPAHHYAYPNNEADYSSSLQQVNGRVFATNNIGVYGQDLMQFAQKWKLLFGLRFDDTRTNYNGTEDLNNSVVKVSTRSQSISQRYALMYQPDDYSTYYVSYGTSFNPKGNLETSTNDSALRSKNSVTQKSATTEVGVKMELMEGALSLRGALFRSHLPDIRGIDSSNNDAYVLNRKITINGAEFEMIGNITNQWEVFTSVTFLDTSFRKDNTVKSGLDTTNTPDFSGTFWNNFRLNDAWKIGGGANFMTERKGYYTSNNNMTQNVTRIPGFVRYDAMAQWSAKKYYIRFNVMNLLNTEYYDSIHGFGRYAIPARARNFQLSFNYKF